jgi:hypothetical protein
MIKGKIEQVGDEICAHCAQNYSGECRAFEAPHSDQERAAREKGDALCITSRAAFIGSRRTELREEEVKEQGR